MIYLEIYFKGAKSVSTDDGEEVKINPNTKTPKPSKLKGKVSNLISRFEQGFGNSADVHVSLSDSNPAKTIGNIPIML